MAIVTHEETEKNFQEGLAYFKSEPIEERKFSIDLVPVRLTEETVKDCRFTFLASQPRYAFYSVKGEDISFNISAGNCPGAPDFRYHLTDPSGKTVASGIQPPDDKPPHPLLLKVPKPGLYYLDILGGNTATICGISRPSDQPWTIALADSANPAHCGDIPQPLYFYVPKGTKKIQFCGWDGYGNHMFKIRNPDGQPIEDIPTGKALRSIPVNPGDDGFAWSITGLCLGRLYFFNIPNYVAPSPNALLVPREVAVADKLIILK